MHRNIWTRTRSQHGLVTGSQLQAEGVSRASLRNLLATGEFERVHHGVFRLSGSPHSSSQQALAAVLAIDAPAALSHHSAASMWGIPGYRLAPFHVTTLRSGRHTETHAAILHQPRNLSPTHLVECDNVPITSPVRTVFDLAGRVHFGALARMVDFLWTRGLGDHESFNNMLSELAKRGRPGIRNMRLLLAERGPDYVAPESGLERRFMQLAEKAGVRSLQRQVNLGGDSWEARVDFFEEALKLVIEIDSDRFHTALVDVAADAQRQQLLTNAGFWVVRFTEHQIWYESKEVIKTMKAIAQRLNRKDLSNWSK